ncbi:hypothetical protein [Streptomyces sp. ALI-76-A]|uniref:hypothetical protein n=1 Tax=Streptomyces sp. ALI-76-A TaxID=3025736 RepID=UPI00256EA10C|nr:hypothetical protein [Streptomyces sp. ALI-76-A]MDL5202761.1 hypothetical protein [Streptomyces sp. ALI-76-A]
MSKGRRDRAAASGAISVLALALITPLASAALTDPSAPAAPARDRVTDTSRLPAGWRESDDRMVIHDGDSTGLHVLVADAAHAYAWRTAATLSEPGVVTDRWTGRSCVTGSGDRAVVVYAPRPTAAAEQGFQPGGFAAVVDLAHGTVTKLPQLVSLAYVNPGCGVGEQAVLSRPQGAGTRLLTVDARKGRLTRQQTVPCALTSAVPFGSGIAAATGDAVVSVDREGRLRTLARTATTPTRLVPDADGGLAYQVPDAGNQARVRRITRDGSDRLLGSGALGGLALRGTGGRVFVTGEDAPELLPDTALPKSWRALAVPASSEVSSTGALAVTGVGDAARAAEEPTVEVIPFPGSGTGTRAEPVHIRAVSPVTGADFTFEVHPEAPRRDQGAERSPALSSRTGDDGTPSAGMRPGNAEDGPQHTTPDPDHPCAVSRDESGLPGP